MHKLTLPVAILAIATAASTALAAAPSTHYTEGSITKIDEAARTMTLGNSQTYHLTESVNPFWLWIGEDVQVSYTLDGRRAIAHAVTPSLSGVLAPDAPIGE